MFLLVFCSHVGTPQKVTNMASPYKALWIKVKHFPEYLAYEKLHWPEFRSLYIYLLLFPWTWVLSIERFWFLFSMGWQWKPAIDLDKQAPKSISERVLCKTCLIFPHINSPFNSFCQYTESPVWDCLNL